MKVRSGRGSVFARAVIIALSLSALGSGGCGAETGTLRVSISGEEGAVSGFPVEDGPAFEDGWSLTFDVLVVSVSGLELRGLDGEDAALEVEPKLVDLTAGDALLYELVGVGARRWEDVRYTIAPPTADSVDVGAVNSSVRARMIDEGWSVYLEATATRGVETRTLAWGFDMDVLNEHCVAGDGTDGVVVASGGISEGQITLHWDHLFFDSLRLDEAAMRFDAIAAAADADGHVTLASLATQRLADLRGLDGEPLVDAEGESVFYDPASVPLPEPTLEHMVRAATTTVGHWNGEGHCAYVVR